MRLRIVAFVLAMLCAVGLAAWALQRWRRDYFVSPPRTFATLREAREAGVIDRGWLPGFLPACATDIREKHNAEQNTVIATFQFAPATALTNLLQNAEELPASALPGIRPRRVGGSEPWFPEALFQGQLDQLKPPGFRIYRIARVSRQGAREVLYIWYLALNSRTGICYLWFFVGLPQRGIKDQVKPEISAGMCGELRRMVLGAAESAGKAVCPRHVRLGQEMSDSGKSLFLIRSSR